MNTSFLNTIGLWILLNVHKPVYGLAPVHLKAGLDHWNTFGAP